LVRRSATITSESWINRANRDQRLCSSDQSRVDQRNGGASVGAVCITNRHRAVLITEFTTDNRFSLLGFIWRASGERSAATCHPSDSRRNHLSRLAIARSVRVRHDPDRSSQSICLYGARVRARLEMETAGRCAGARAAREFSTSALLPLVFRPTDPHNCFRTQRCVRLLMLAIVWNNSNPVPNAVSTRPPRDLGVFAGRDPGKASSRCSLCARAFLYLERQQSGLHDDGLIN